MLSTMYNVTDDILCVLVIQATFLSSRKGLRQIVLELTLNEQHVRIKRLRTIAERSKCHYLNRRFPRYGQNGRRTQNQLLLAVILASG